VKGKQLDIFTYIHDPESLSSAAAAAKGNPSPLARSASTALLRILLRVMGSLKGKPPER